MKNLRLQKAASMRVQNFPSDLYRPLVAMLVEVVLAFSALYISYSLYHRRHRQLDLPRLGPPTIFGYIWTAIRFTFKPHEVTKEGRSQFPGRPYILPSFCGPLVILSGDDMELLRTSNDSVVRLLD